MECKESGFSKQNQLATWPRDLTKSRVQAASKQNCQTGIFVLQYSSWRDSSSYLHASLMCIIQRFVNREFQSRVPTILQKLEHFFTLSHTLSLHDSHLNTGLLIELQTWHEIKPTKWLIKSNLTTGEEEWRRSDGRDMVSENGKYVCKNGDCKETSRKFPSSKTNPRFLGPIWLVSLSNVV